MTVRLGLIGCGTVARYGHLPAIQALDGAELRAVFDPSPKALEMAAGLHKAEVATTSPDEFFGAGLDAVAIASPLPFHADNIRAAIRHNCHVLCEKPLTMTEEEGLDAARAAREAGVMLFTGFDYRFSPVALTIRDLIREGAIGQVGFVRLAYLWNCHGKYEAGPDGIVRENARRWGRMDEGGPLVDCGVHQVDLSRWWLGSEVKSVHGFGGWLEEHEMPDHMVMHMDHENGCHTMVDISYAYCHTAEKPMSVFTYEIIGADGLIRYDREAKTFELRSRHRTEQLPYAEVKNFNGMYAAFVQALATGRAGDVLATAEDGVVATRLTREATAEACRRRVRLFKDADA